MPVALPIDDVLPQLVAAVRDRRTAVLVAPPGAGKTTRVPGALLDAGAVTGEIVVLQPRRLAARLAATRVASERKVELGGEVGYEVRFDRRSSASTKIRFVTEGVLTRRLLSDPDLRGVGAVIIDEFHERHLDGDLALALVARLRDKRPELALIVMSATLDAEPVAKFLGDAPIVRSEGRTFAVSIEHEVQPDDRPLGKQVAAAVRRVAQEKLDGDVLVFLPGSGEIRRCAEDLADVAALFDLAILPLHGDLTVEEQDRAVGPSKQRKVILSTNVAETSVTIDGVVCVIDSGLARIARHSPWTGLPSLQIESVSRASCAQRAGRAGRTRPGRVIRLYTKHDHDTRRAFEVPEVSRTDLAGAALELYGAGIDGLGGLKWYEAPPAAAATAAVETLTRLGAIEPAKPKVEGSKVEGSKVEGAVAGSGTSSTSSGPGTGQQLVQVVPDPATHPTITPNVEGSKVDSDPATHPAITPNVEGSKVDSLPGLRAHAIEQATRLGAITGSGTSSTSTGPRTGQQLVQVVPDPATHPDPATATSAGASRVDARADASPSTPRVDARADASRADARAEAQRTDASPSTPRVDASRVDVSRVDARADASRVDTPRTAQPDVARASRASGMRITPLGRRMLRFPVHPRLARIVCEAEVRGVAREASVIAALVGARELRLEKRGPRHDPRAPGITAKVSAPSDLIEDLDAILDARSHNLRADRLRRDGLDISTAHQVDKTAKQLERIARDEKAGPANDDDVDRELMVAILTGFPDRVGKRRAPRSPEIVFAGGGSGTLAPSSAVIDAELLVAVDVAETGSKGQASKVQIRRASAIEATWLLDLYLDRLDERDVLEWNAQKERVERVVQMTYDGLPIDEQRSPAPATREAAEILAKQALAAGMGKFVDVDALAQWRARMMFVAKHAPQVTAPTDDALASVIARACEGATSFAELRQMGLLDLLDAGEHKALVDRLAPTHLALPRRRRVAIHYELDRPPWIESRMQDFFGLARAPSVGDGRVPLVLHLLAPNQRPVQVTQDLPGFWVKHYPGLRKQLMRRYPKHQWPEDPTLLIDE